MKRTSMAAHAARLTPWEKSRFERGHKALVQGRRLVAARHFAKMIDRNPKCVPALFLLGGILTVSCDHEGAMKFFHQALRADPGFAEAWYNLGTVLQHVNEYQRSVSCLEQAVALWPEMVKARINLGNALLGLARFDEAFAFYESALAFSPEDAEAKWNIAHYFILTGDWLRGWQYYEARWQIPGFCEINAIAVDDSRPGMPCPWRGADLHGKTLLVVEEQGYGDWISTLRFAPTLRARGATTTWACRPEMMRLTALAVAPDHVVSIRDEVPSGDYVVTCMTLMHRLGITPENIPGADGYLRAA